MVVAVVVYDRFQNILEWVRCWNLCETQGSELVIIHNYANEADKESYKVFCQGAGVTYVPRENVGYDVGAFADVCRNRLPGFPDYEFLLWVCDDALPMRKDFIKQYLDCFKHFKVGVAALEISKAVRTHIRTTGFAIRKEVAEKLQFPADPITTKEQCYFFEHRGGPHIFLDQVIRLGYKAVQVSPVQTACFWDSGFKKYRNREKEHYQLFPRPAQGTAKIAFICPVYQSHPQIISSLINQTHQNWVLYLIHDGENITGLQKLVDTINDPRIIYTETAYRAQHWGHLWRRQWIEKMKGTDVDYICVTNADNQHVPTYCEYMLKGFTNGQVATYCAQMSHSYLGWKIIECRLQQGYLDAAGVLVRADVATAIGWPDVEAHSADWTYFKAIIDKYGANKFAKVPGMLLVHN
jgi:hypothetical protein